MAAQGAKILHLRCVEYARRYDMPIHVRSSFSQKEGTWVVRAEDVSAGGAQGTEEAGSTMEAAIITGVAHDSSQAKITIVRSEEHTSELQSLMRTPSAVFRLKNNNKN